jgi:hypothetical protein
MTVFDARGDVTVLEIESRQYGTGAQSFVFVIPTDGGVLAGHRGKIRGHIANGLHARFLIHRNGDDAGSDLAGKSVP